MVATEPRRDAFVAGWLTQAQKDRLRAVVAITGHGSVSNLLCAIADHAHEIPGVVGQGQPTKAGRPKKTRKS